MLRSTCSFPFQSKEIEPPDHKDKSTHPSPASLYSWMDLSKRLRRKRGGSPPPCPVAYTPFAVFFVPWSQKPKLFHHSNEYTVIFLFSASADFQHSEMSSKIRILSLYRFDFGKEMSTSIDKKHRPAIADETDSNLQFKARTWPLDFWRWIQIQDTRAIIEPNQKKTFDDVGDCNHSCVTETWICSQI